MDSPRERQRETKGASHGCGASRFGCPQRETTGYKRETRMIQEGDKGRPQNENLSLGTPEQNICKSCNSAFVCAREPTGDKRGNPDFDSSLVAGPQNENLSLDTPEQNICKNCNSAFVCAVFSSAQLLTLAPPAQTQ